MDRFSMKIILRDVYKRQLLHCCKRRKIQTVLEFFTVGDSPTAVLFRAVEGGGKLPQHKISKMCIRD